MTTLALPRAALRALLLRAGVLWVLLRMLLVAASLLAALTRDDPVEVAKSALGNPVQVVVLCTVVGLIDVRRRKEIALWNNLGLSSTQLTLLFALVATVAELLLAAGRR